MDRDAAPLVVEATSNGEVELTDLPDQLKGLHVTHKSDGAPVKSVCQDGTEKSSKTGPIAPKENGMANHTEVEEHGDAYEGNCKTVTEKEPNAAGRQPVQEPPAATPAAESDDLAAPEAGSGGYESAPLTYSWQPVESDSAVDDQLAPLTFPADVLAKEADNKRWKPQGITKKLLESYHIYIVKKPPSHHKNAKYVCRVCELHWDTLKAVRKHVNDQRHADNTRRHQELTAVHTLPEPTAAQTDRLTELLTEVYSEHGLTEQRLRERHRVTDQLKDTLSDGLKQRNAADGWSLEVFGSSRHGCGFADSCLDVALLPTEESRGAALLTEAIRVLQDSELFTEVEHDFQSWSPHVRCVHAPSGQRCQVSLGADRDVQLARLVELYTAVDGRTAPLAVAFRHLARLCEMDRPHAGSLPPSAFVVMTIYHLQQCQPAVLPALHELVAGGPMYDEPPAELDFEAAAAVARSWRSENTADLGALWLSLLRFYALELIDSDAVVSIRQRALITRADKGWNKKISIEDPIQYKRNISRSISGGAVTDVIMDRLRAACLLFGVARTAAGPAVRLVAGRGPPPPAAAARLGERLAGLTRQQIQYQFDQHLLCGETSMPTVCSVCQKTGHLADDCPTLVVPPAEPLPAPPQQQIHLLDAICSSVFSDWAPPAIEYQFRQNMLQGIEQFIRRHAFPSARLTLFGSSCNGFGFRNSDLDICLTFDDCTDPQSLDQSDIILRLAHTLNRLRSVCDVIPISTAKVPIVKFTDRRSRLEGDISLYNTLAQHNTLMLHTYAKLDSRARMLGYMVKLMAKICDICDASRGSLSSYAYTLMLIYYLQRCKPAVLPVLQELEAADRPPQRVDGADVGFFTDLKRLPQLWPDAGRNTASVGELWLGFLRFYGEHFDFERNVVCIRRTEVLTKFEKLWNGAFIAIEDPFLLSHNLGGGVRRKMASFIRRTLLQWRLHHHRPAPSPLPRGYRDIRAFLMSGDLLCEGTPPSAGGCHACGRIGHWAADCQRRRRRPPPAATGKQPRRGGPAADPVRPARSPTRDEPPPRPPTEAESDARTQSKCSPSGAAAAGGGAAAAEAPAAAAPGEHVTSTDAASTSAAAASASAVAAAAAAAAAAATSTATPVAGKKPKKRARRRKPDKAGQPASDARDGGGAQRTRVFCNSNQGGGGAPAPAAST